MHAPVITGMLRGLKGTTLHHFCCAHFHCPTVRVTFDELLIDYSKDLPKVAEMLKVHPVAPEDHFRMLPGFKNFQSIKAGDLLAEDRNGNIISPYDSHILMPLYQQQGEDGFFLIKVIE